jgi:hypothetical protein
VASHADEVAIRAAFVLNFARFTVWPTDAFIGDGAKLKLCVDKQAPGADRFSELEGKQAGERILTVQFHSRNTGMEGCHIIHVVDADRNSIQRTLAAVNGKPVLTIGETHGFVEMGGVINLVVMDGKLRFQIGREAAERVGLRLSSQLLKLAVSVE